MKLLLFRSQFVLIFFAILALSIGQIILKMAANSLEWSTTGFLNSLRDFKLILALFVYFLGTLLWLLVLKTTSLRVAYPFAAFAFIIVPILAHYSLGEKIYWNTFVGGLLIAVGVWVSVYK